jgi:uncharacterized protein YciU (UPF0263 family)
VKHLKILLRLAVGTALLAYLLYEHEVRWADLTEPEADALVAMLATGDAGAAEAVATRDLAERLLRRPVDEPADHAEVHVGLEESEANLAQSFAHVALGKAPLAAQALENRPQAFR